MPVPMRRIVKTLASGWPGRSPAPGILWRAAAKMRRSPRCHAFFERLPVGLRSRFWRMALGVPTFRKVSKATTSLPGCVPYGLNIAGYLRAEIGLGESARLAAQACEDVGLPFSAHDIPVSNSSRADDRRWEHRIVGANRHWINVLHINPDYLPAAYRHFGAGFFEGHYNIGYWAWELSEFPDEWTPAFELVDEVWAPSRFVVEAIRRKSPVPVVRMPHGVRVVPDARVRRCDLGLPDSKFLFLTMYDAHSYQGRKNPQAAIRAFFQAFPDAKDVALVVKINNARRFPEQIRSLEALVQGRPGIILLDRVFSRQEVYNLESLCDCFVSLHRSEGFGLGLAESMALGKPVIGTNWSGNVDFMSPGDSCCVNWSPLPVGSDYPLSTPDASWADADVEHAAWFMTRLANDRVWTRELGLRARARITQEFSPEAVGRLYRARLEAIAGQYGRTWRGADEQSDPPP